FIRPLGWLMTLPAPWICAFYHNATVLGDGRRERGPSVYMASLEQAKLWPWQALALLAIQLLFAFFVWLNLSVLLISLPSLLKTLLGMETMASRSGMSYVMNSTFWAATVALTALCVDPLWRAVFVVRCFHGESIQSGADIRARIKALRT